MVKKPHPLALPPRASPELARLMDVARDFIAHARSPRTVAQYKSQWTLFVRWCEQHGLACLPAAPETLALYVTHLSERGLAMSTLELALAAIAEAHKIRNHASPRKAAVVREALKGIRRLRGRPARGREPLLADQFQQMLSVIPDSLRGRRDRALLMFGFLGGFRRSELVGMRWNDLTVKPDGIIVQLFGSKDDRALKGRVVAIPRAPNRAVCPVDALDRYRRMARIVDGPVFRSVDRHGNVGGALSGRDVARIVKRYASAAGLDETVFSGHSLRSGMVTSAHLAGAPLESIMKVTGHKSYDTTMKYVRKADLFRQHPSAGLLDGASGRRGRL